MWTRGEFLRDAVVKQSRFPLGLRLKTPNSSEITARFNAVRDWAAELSSTKPLRLEWRVVRHRVQGEQRLPARAWVDSIDDVLILLSKRRDWDRFAILITATQDADPCLLPWLQKRPLQALSLADDWPRLLAVVNWLREHPRPNVYLRQVDIPNVHTKFIETHRGVLSELFDLALLGSKVEDPETGVNLFSRRFGFLTKPSRIRFRVLDPKLPSILGTACPDVALDAESFSRARLDVSLVFITENEINFLSFPPVEGAIVIFGAGYGWDALARSDWLNSCTIYYWGDIDTHGFSILDQLRSHFSHVNSFLMDRQTLEAHKEAWGEEEKPSLADRTRLTADEQALYDALRDNRIRPRLRLEQEHIRFGWVEGRLQFVQTGASPLGTP
jgi:hypothetical protein